MSVSFTGGLNSPQGLGYVKNTVKKQVENVAKEVEGEVSEGVSKEAATAIKASTAGLIKHSQAKDLEEAKEMLDSFMKKLKDEAERPHKDLHQHNKILSKYVTCQTQKMGLEKFGADYVKDKDTKNFVEGLISAIKKDLGIQ